MEAKGYRLIVAENGQEAIALAQAEKPDLILMDIQMPALDGLSAIQQLRQNPEFQTLPIIALTALAMAGDQDKCLQAGANDYLSKPVRLRELVGCMQKLLKNTPKPLDFS
ncbi:MAG: response regulator [Microcystaceae cyanobacterium]